VTGAERSGKLLEPAHQRAGNRGTQRWHPGRTQITSGRRAGITSGRRAGHEMRAAGEGRNRQRSIQDGPRRGTARRRIAGRRTARMNAARRPAGKRTARTARRRFARRRFARRRTARDGAAGH
jgi:hypothetical protein